MIKQSGPWLQYVTNYQMVIFIMNQGFLYQYPIVIRKLHCTWIHLNELARRGHAAWTGCFRCTWTIGARGRSHSGLGTMMGPPMGKWFTWGPRSLRTHGFVGLNFEAAHQWECDQYKQKCHGLSFQLAAFPWDPIAGVSTFRSWSLILICFTW